MPILKAAGHRRFMLRGSGPLTTNPMPRTYNIYCDESCHLEHDHLGVMALGAVWCPAEKGTRGDDTHQGDQGSQRLGALPKPSG